MRLKAVARIRTEVVFRVAPRSRAVSSRLGAKAALAMYRRRHGGIAERNPADGSWSFYGDDAFETYVRRGESVGVQAGVRFYDTAAVLLWVDETANAAVRELAPPIHYGDRLVERIDAALAGKPAARAAFAAGIRTCPDCETVYSQTADCVCVAAAGEVEDLDERGEDGGGFGADERNEGGDLLEAAVEVETGWSLVEDEEEDEALDQAIEAYRVEEAARIAADAGDRESLERRHGEVWDEEQLVEEFEVLEILKPLLIVRRKSELRVGTLKVQDSPRFYFGWEAAD